MSLMTPGMRKAILLMAEAEDEGRHDECELVRERGRCWIGYERTTNRVLGDLLSFLLLKDVSDVKGIERYILDGSARGALRRPELLDEIAGALRSGISFTVRDDRVLPLTGEGRLPPDPGH